LIISVILGHPDKDSFNHAIAETTCEALEGLWHEVFFHDLYKEKFDPILPAKEIPNDAALPRHIEAHYAEIAQADGIVIVHPNWWGQPPAILKGWVDQVIRPGVAYEFAEEDTGEGVPVKLLKAKAALVFTTSNSRLTGSWRFLETRWRRYGGIAYSGCAGSVTSTAAILGWWSPALRNREGSGWRR
jgi:putative NADPH-quinone reductase